MSCNIEVAVTSIALFGVHNTGKVLKSLLEKKLECDKKFSEVVSYIEEKSF